MKKIEFWKMSGSGNDFVVVDNRRKIINGSASRWAAELCHRQFGVGADGLLLLEPSQRADFRMVYYNADGSRASMCGNGARCMAWTAHEKGLVGSRFAFETDAGIVKAEVQGPVVKITLSDPFDFIAERRLTIEGKTLRVASVNTGVPHAIVEVKDAEKVDLPTLGRQIRFHKAFGPKGTNVNVVQRLNDHALRVRTYERGVEGETLACGTGVAASALAMSLLGRVRPTVRCKTTGGDVLEVDFDMNPDTPARPARRVTLRGPVRRTFVGEWSRDARKRS